MRKDARASLSMWMAVTAGLGGLAARGAYAGAVDTPAILPDTAAATSWALSAWTDTNNVPFAAGDYPSGTHAAVTLNAPAAASRATTVGTGFQITLPSLTFNVGGSTGTLRVGGTNDPGLLIWNTGTSDPAVVTENGTGTGQARISVPSDFISNVVAVVNQTSNTTSARGPLWWAAPVSNVGTGGFTKQGPGILSLVDNPKNWTGPTILDTNSGRTRMDVAGQTASTSSFTIRSGAQLDITEAGTFTLGTGTLFLNGTGLGAGSVPGNFPGAIRDDTNLAVTITNPVELQSDTLIHCQGAATGSNTFSGVISGAHSLTLTAPNSNQDLGTYVLSNPGNSYSGGTIINGGTLDATAGSIGTGPLTANVITFGGAQTTVKLNTSSPTSIGSFSGSKNGSANSLLVDNGGQLLTVNQTTDGTFEGNLTGAGGLTKNGPSQLTLDGTNSYTGNTTVNAGTLKVATPLALPGYNAAGTVSVASGGTLKLLAGPANWTETAINDAYTNATLPAGSNFAIDTSAGDFTYGSSMGKANGFTKAGTNALTLTAANSYTGGTTVSAGTLVAGHSAAFANGALDVADGAKAQVQSGLANAVVVTTLNTHSTGQMDVTNGSMVIRGSDAATVRAQLASGFAGGDWNGPGINSSTAAGDSTGLTSVGYASNASLNLTDFKGVSGLNANDVIVEYTYAGDANLDGKVDIGDLGLLAGAWQQSGKVWFDGDFTYDGSVNIGDLGLLAGNWQKGVTSGQSLMSFSAAMSQFAAFDGVVVPEPASVGLLGLAGLGLLGRRRRGSN